MKGRESDVVGLLRNIRDEAREKTPDGEIYDVSVSVTDAIFLLDGRTNNTGQRDLDWSSFSLINNGPDNVYCSVNEWRDPEVSIAINQSFNADLKKRGAIKRIYLKCAAGGTATVGIRYMR